MKSVPDVRGACLQYETLPLQKPRYHQFLWILAVLVCSMRHFHSRSLAITSSFQQDVTHTQNVGVTLALCIDSCMAVTTAGTTTGPIPEETQRLDLNPPHENIDQFRFRQNKIR